MSAFRDLDEILVDKPVRLPIKGKTYEFPGSIPARTGLMLQRIAAAAHKAKNASPTDLAEEVLSDEEEIDLRGELMGSTEVEMARDGLTTAHTSHVFQTLLIWHMAGEEAAAAAWESLGKVQVPNRAARRASRGSASTTRSPASTSTTTTPPRKRAAPASPGSASSSTGA